MYYFPPLTAVLFTFPSRYLFTIGRQLVFRLTPWSAQIHTKFHVRRITQEIPRRAPVFGYGPFTLYGAAFQKLHLTFALPHRASTTPLPLQNLTNETGFTGLTRFTSQKNESSEFQSCLIPLILSAFQI